jgi:hypothetical protein
MAKAVESLPSKHEAEYLSSNPSTTKNKCLLYKEFDSLKISLITC